MAEEHKATEADIENIKKAIVSAGFLKAVSISHEEEARLTKALAEHGLDVEPESRNWKFICNLAHYCLIVPKTTTTRA
jgi:hypothetical protein